MLIGVRLTIAIRDSIDKDDWWPLTGRLGQFHEAVRTSAASGSLDGTRLCSGWFAVAYYSAAGL
jgi:hypothetical protein